MNGHAPALYPGFVRPRLSWLRRLVGWLLGEWQAECHRFDQAGRSEPYY